MIYPTCDKEKKKESIKELIIIIAVCYLNDNNIRYWVNTNYC